MPSKVEYFKLSPKIKEICTFLDTKKLPKERKAKLLQQLAASLKNNPALFGPHVDPKRLNVSLGQITYKPKSLLSRMHQSQAGGFFRIRKK